MERFALLLLVCPAAGLSSATARRSLLEAIQSTRHGLDASTAQRGEIARLAVELAAGSPEAPLTSPRIAATWRLVYTSGAQIPSSGELMRTIDTSAEPWLLRDAVGFPVFTCMTAQLLPRADNPGHAAEVSLLELTKLGVREQTPAEPNESVDFLYLDDELLISRMGVGGDLTVCERAGPLVPLPRIRRGGKGFYQGRQYIEGFLSTSKPAPIATAGLDSLTPNIKAAGMGAGALAAITAAFLGANGLLPGQAGMPPPPY
ncbi:hypothetical protein T492DRAFT_989398 [Pavlovales sp. CCMP2436]|nr:hypothetical protein T492DRAFT_989398 [Pavlovales sp. CCMP2436]